MVELDKIVHYDLAMSTIFNCWLAPREKNGNDLSCLANIMPEKIQLHA
jgi:hypothetical protein